MQFVVRKKDVRDLTKFIDVLKHESLIFAEEKNKIIVEGDTDENIQKYFDRIYEAHIA